LVNGLTLAVLSILIIIEALNRFQQPSEVDSSLMLTVSLIGLGVNLVGMFVLRGRKDENLNVKGAYLHMMGDLLSSIGVIVAALLIQWFGLILADPLISIFIGVVIIIGAYELVERSISILLEAVPSHIDLDEVERTLQGLDGVARVHDIHIWTLTSGVYAMSAHILVQDRTVSSCDPLMREINQLVKNKFQITHLTLQIESVTEDKCAISD
jgi:cobalt-zinc-cadmium efflux system protein